MLKQCRICLTSKPLSMFTIRDKVKQTRRTECKPCINKLRVAQPSFGKWHKNNKLRVKDYMRNYDLKRHYGLTVQEYEIIFDLQERKCAICKTPNFSGRGNKAHVDHCHTSGKIRGLLCGPCNIALGGFKDNIASLQAAIEYIKLHQIGDTK